MAAFQWLLYDSIDFKPADLNKTYGGHEPEIKINEKRSMSRTLRRKYNLLKIGRKTFQIKKHGEISFNRVRENVKMLLSKEYMKFSLDDFFELFSQIEQILMSFLPVFSYICMSGTFPNLMLTKVMEKSFPGKGNGLANALLAGAATITSAEHGYRLVELAETARNDINAKNFFTATYYDPLLWENKLLDESAFKQGFKNFLDEFGHRAVYEMDVINPRWREDPSYPLNIIRSILETADIGEIRAAQREKREKAWAEVSKMPFYRRWLVKSLVKQIEKSVELREMGKSLIVSLYEPVRTAAQEFGRCFKERGILGKQEDIYHCTLLHQSAFI